MILPSHGFKLTNNKANIVCIYVIKNDLDFLLLLNQGQLSLVICAIFLLFVK